MNLEQRISSFSRLGEVLRSYLEAPSALPGNMQRAMELAEKENPWFTRNNILEMLSYWAEALAKPSLEKWMKAYEPAARSKINPKRVGVVMAGNIPMVGFHDLLSVLLSGNILVGKLSSQDAYLIPALVEVLVEAEPGWRDWIELGTGEIKNQEAVIATGSNNTSRYFRYYFGKYPHIIRNNRTGVAVLDGRETMTELQGIAADVFSYFGLGCRNVSKLYLPEGYDLKPLHEAFVPYQDLFHHQKYRNNLDYYKSICLVNRTRFLDGVFYLLIEMESLATPVAVIHYAHYNDLAAIQESLDRQREQVQCIVARNGLIPGTVSPGETQKPALSDYADGVDTMEFLLEKI